MNVLHIISTLEIGGVELQLLEVLKRLDRSRFNSIVCCLNRGGALTDDFLKLGIEVIVLRRRFRFDPLLIKQIIRVVKEKRIDIVHTYMFTANSWGTLSSRIAGVPVIINSVRDIEVWKKRHHRFIDRMLFPSVDVIITNSDATRDFMINNGRLDREKFVTVYNGIDVSKFTPCTSGLDNESPTIGTVARLDEPKKGLIFLIGAMEIIIREMPHCQLVIAGDGPSRGDLEEIVRVRGLKENVKFLGFRRDIPKLLAGMDVFVLPSLWEGLGNAVLEAMAMGKPVVAANVGGIPEVVINEKTGFLVSAGNSAALADAIIKLLKSPEIRAEIGKAGRNRVEENFRIEKTVEKLQSIYNELIRRKLK